MTVSMENPYGEIPTKKEPIRTFGFPLRLPRYIMCCIIIGSSQGLFQHFRQGPLSLLDVSRSPREEGKGDFPGRNRSVLLQNKAASVSLLKIERGLN